MRKHLGRSGLARTRERSRHCGGPRFGPVIAIGAEGADGLRCGGEERFGHAIAFRLRSPQRRMASIKASMSSSIAAYLARWAGSG
jgi:hypothetical protein